MTPQERSLILSVIALVVAVIALTFSVTVYLFKSGVMR